MLDTLKPALLSELMLEVQVFSSRDEDGRYESEAFFRGRQLALAINWDRVKAESLARFQAFMLIREALSR